MEDLDRFYGATDVELPDQWVRQITESLFAEPMAAYVLLAWDVTAVNSIAPTSPVGLNVCGVEFTGRTYHAGGG